MVEKFDQNTREGKCAQSPARERYSQEYRDEIQLNEEFDKFVTNFQQAYEGPNTAHAQTGSKYDARKLILRERERVTSSVMWSTAYSEGDECLPLGPAFQVRGSGAGVL